jgi:hypothetical protein
MHTRLETTTCLVWNERDQASAEEELTYEVAWIPELCMWRRFLRSRRKVTADSSQERCRWEPCSSSGKWQ